MFADRLPAWRSRRRYQTVAERCAACTLYGGREEPCESEARLRDKWERLFGQRCPRVDLWPENRVALRLTQLLIGEHTRTLAPLYVVVAGPADDDGRARLMMVATAAMNDERVDLERRALADRRGATTRAPDTRPPAPPAAAGPGAEVAPTLRAVRVVDGRAEG